VVIDGAGAGQVSVMSGWAIVILGLLGAGLLGAIVALERRSRRLRLRLKEIEQRLSETRIVVRDLAGADSAERIGRSQPAGAVEAAFHSGYGEDLLLFQLFNPRSAPIRADGFYVECGAFDGVRRSVTHIFDACGWRGLLVEALLHLAEQCRRNRPRARVMHAALGPRGSSGMIDFAHRTDNEGLSCAPSLREGSGRRSSARADSTKLISVPLMSMDDALGNHGGPIDLVVLDVEGSELAVLRGFDLARWQPAVLLIEDNTYGENAALLGHITSAGYRSIRWLSRNRLLIHESQTAPLARAKEMTLTRDPHKKSIRGKP